MTARGPVRSARAPAATEGPARRVAAPRRGHPLPDRDLGMPDECSQTPKRWPRRSGGSVCRPAAAAPESGAGPAGIVILNTCSVREKAQEKVFSRVEQLTATGGRRPFPDRGRGLCGPAGGRPPFSAALPRWTSFSAPRASSVCPRWCSGCSTGRRGSSKSVAIPTISTFRRSRSSGCRESRRSSRSWRVATTSARSASSPSRAAGNGAGRCPPSSGRPNRWPRPGSRKSNCSARM